MIERILWLIKLRWLATAGVILTGFLVSMFPEVSINSAPLFFLAATLALYNLAFFLYLKQISRKTPLNLLVTTNRIANIQISLDLFILTALIHFSGGVENPFIFYFIFHMIIASILLSRRASFWQATFATGLFCMMVALEYGGFLPHHCLVGFMIGDQHNNLAYITGVSFALISTLYIAVYMATSISKMLKQANMSLRKKDRLKSEYVLRVTHDIKEHLSAIQSCIQPVTAGITGSLNEKQKDLLDRADRRSGKLIFFVRALLEITRIKLNEKVRTSIFSINEVAQTAIASMQPRANKKDITISSNLDPGAGKIQGVQAYIEEAISNLLANSIKYTPKTGKISLTVEGKGSDILIKIKDTGIGISKEDLQKVFEEFYRGSNAKEIERDGSGLGLSIVKQIAERHKGKIWVESELGKGSTFFILLPVTQ